MRKGCFGAKDLKLTNSYLKKIRLVAIHYAATRGHESIAEDFAQEYLMAMCRGRKVDLFFMLTDYLRANFGGKRSKPRPIICSLTDEFDAIHSMNYESAIHFIIDYSSLVVGKLFDDREKLIIDHLYQGHTAKEISVFLDLTEGRMSQIIKEIKNKFLEGTR